MSRDLQLAFAQETYEACNHRCAACGYEGPFLQAHHVIGKQLLKHDETLRWDSDNGLLVCFDPAPNRCHERHTVAFKRIPRSALRPENHAFAERHGFTERLIREYPDEAVAA